MTLAPGTRLGADEIVSASGAGGRGEVDRAKDTTLNRDVAINARPESFGGVRSERPATDRGAIFG